MYVLKTYHLCNDQLDGLVINYNFFAMYAETLYGNHV